MARITKIDRGGYRRHTVHDPVETTLGYVFETEGRTYARFDSYGRSTRDKPGKVSQSIQVDREGAQEIYKLLKSRVSRSQVAGEAIPVERAAEARRAATTLNKGRR